MKETALREALERLVEAELVYQRGLPPKAIYTFKHALVQDTAYQSLLAEPAQGTPRAHRRRARGALPRARRPRARGDRPTLRAGGPHRRGDRLTTSGRGSRRHSASPMPRRSGHLDRAMELLRTLPESSERDRQELSLQSRLGAALAALNRVEPRGPSESISARGISPRSWAMPRAIPNLVGGWMRFTWVRAEHTKAGDDWRRRCFASPERHGTRHSSCVAHSR